MGREERDGGGHDLGTVGKALSDSHGTPRGRPLLGARPQRLLVRATLFSHLPANHLQFLAVHDAEGKMLGNQMLNSTENSFTFSFPTGEAAATAGEPRVSTFGGFLRLGVKHIWTGYDHLLFLFGLLIVTRNFTSSLKIITCFTIAHSLTLAVATLSLVKIPSRIVEPLIAVSIIYVGIENLISGGDPRCRWMLTLP